MRVLVVDDDPAIATMVATVLSLAGFDTAECHDGDQALAAMRRHRPDVVVLDIMMPNKDGLTALSEMRGDPTLQDIPVVIMSARSDDQDLWNGWQHGADSYLVKPFDTDVLTTEVLRVLAARRSGAPPE